MDDESNVLLKSGAPAPRRSRWAVASFVSSVLTLAGLTLGRLYQPFVYLFLFFIVAIVSGHMAQRRIAKAPGALTGEGLARFGLSIGYFGLIVSLLAFAVLFWGFLGPEAESAILM